MKIRHGFVSNSSSSSFLVNDLSIIWSASYKTIQLTDSQLTAIEKNYPEIALMSRPIYLTEYISDGGDLHWELYQTDHSKCIEYMPGNHGCPYSEENYDELIPDRIWILKEHNK